MSKVQYSKVGNLVAVGGPLLADITRVEIVVGGNPVNVLKDSDAFLVEVDIIYPEVIADVQAEYTLNLHCIELVPNPSLEPNMSWNSDDKDAPGKAKLKVNTFDRTWQIDLTAHAAGGATPGVFWFIATLDFGPASDFAAYCFGPVFFVFP